MNATVATGQTPPLSAGSRLSEFRIIPRLETYPQLVSFAQTWVGKLTLLAIFGAGLRLLAPFAVVLPLLAVLVAVSFLPQYRRLVLAVGAVVLMPLQIDPSAVSAAIHLAAVAFGMLLYWCARRWPESVFGRRPIVFLLSGFSALILCGVAARSLGWRAGLLWIVISAATSYLWFIGYALMDRGTKVKDEPALTLASYRPVWGSTNTPFPKGAAYLRRIEAHDAEQLAIVQLKGIKLLAWTILLTLLSESWNLFFHRYLQIPTALEALAMSAQRTPFPWHLCWAAQILAFFESVLGITLFGHRFIACCRMAGFNALRNTYRPFSSTTVSEFFNRFYYYFKELLVDFFFYPTFLRYFKRHRRLRLAAATFAAACLGNAFYHFTRDWWIIQQIGLWRSLENFQVFAFYSFVLAAGLSISQLRKRGPASPGFLRGRLIPALGVGLFYCLLDVFGSTQRNFPLVEHFRFLASLFYLRF